MKRAIEEHFPIAEINRLAAPERNAFKPIYQMHKWFARRASCVFRAILLSALKPAGTNIMEEFYKDHSNDPDTNGKVILDPFMGGGTTIVEALRLGCKVIGIDLNPVAWFIVKTEVEQVDLKELDAAFERLANRIVPWSGKPLRQTLLDLYKTAPPWILEQEDLRQDLQNLQDGLREESVLPAVPLKNPVNPVNPVSIPNSDIIYTFWVKSAICTSPTCRKQVPLFSDYVVAAKSPTVRYYPDCKCPKCNATFDWEVEPATLIADPKLMFHSNAYSGGVGRSNLHWTYAHEEGGIYVCQGSTILRKDSKVTEDSPEWLHVLRQHQSKTGTLEVGRVCCPKCNEIVRPQLTTKKKKRKKVPLTVLLCPQTEEVFQWRGELAQSVMVTSPAGITFDPSKGNISEKGRFTCPHCGNNDAIIKSIRSLPPEQLLPMHAYGLQAYAPGCDTTNDPAKTGDQLGELFLTEATTDIAETEEDEMVIADLSYSGPFVPRTQNLIWKQSGKFYARHAPADQALYTQIEKLWREHQVTLPYPQSTIPDGQETGRLLEHHYTHWWRLFNDRHLLALSTLLGQIQCEKSPTLRRSLLSAFHSLLNNTSNLCTFRVTVGAARQVFARHDYAPKNQPCEISIWGGRFGMEHVQNLVENILSG